MQKREYKVLAPIPKSGGGEWWMQVGRAYDNVDGSVNLYMDAIPVGFTKAMKLQLRAVTEEDLRRREAYRATNATDRAPSIAVHANVPTPTAADGLPF